MLYDVAPLPGFELQQGLLLASLDDSTREWRENLENPPVEAIVWQPWPKGYSIGAILLHIVECEQGWFEEFLGGKPTDPAEAELFMSAQIKQMDCEWPTPPAEPIEWYYALHDRIRARTREALADLADPKQVFSGRVDSFTMRWVLAHVLEHDSYHGGQAVLLHEMWKRLGASR